MHLTQEVVQELTGGSVGVHWCASAGPVLTLMSAPNISEEHCSHGAGNFQEQKVGITGLATEQNCLAE